MIVNAVLQVLLFLLTYGVLVAGALLVLWIIWKAVDRWPGAAAVVLLVFGVLLFFFPH